MEFPAKLWQADPALADGRKPTADSHSYGDSRIGEVPMVTLLPEMDC
jgi:hypothetical protein